MDQFVLGNCPQPSSLPAGSRRPAPANSLINATHLLKKYRSRDRRGIPKWDSVKTKKGKEEDQIKWEQIQQRLQCLPSMSTGSFASPPPSQRASSASWATRWMSAAGGRRGEVRETAKYAFLAQNIGPKSSLRREASLHWKRTCTKF